MQKNIYKLPQKLRSSDLKHLKVFVAIAETGSFSGAQSVLNISASSISTQMSALEQRLGIRLCSRGRSGFQITESGHRVLSAAHKLFNAHSVFEDEVWQTRDNQHSVLKIGLVDDIIGNHLIKLHIAIRQITIIDPSVEIHLLTMPSSEIGQRVLTEKLDMGIGVFSHKIPGLTYKDYLKIDQHLYCSVDHPLYEIPIADISIEAVTQYPYVSRNYNAARESVSGVKFNTAAFADNIEATAILIQSGRFIGHLPAYYASFADHIVPFKVLMPKDLSYKNKFGIVQRRRTVSSAIAKEFLSIFEVLLLAK